MLELAMSLVLTSPAFEDLAPIPRLHTCQGKDLSPPLRWGGAPAGTQSLALIVEDPDVPDPAAPTRTWVHWMLYDIPPLATGLEQGVWGSELPPGTRQGLNDWHRVGYGGPCPPIGRHRYHFRLYALDTLLPDLHEPTRQELLRAMQGHVLDEFDLVGTYQKH